ncbi:hypothetical protein [Halalkalibacter alkalisediminis]|uniref:Acetamidase n=1 Tax=Halalkalibacter alkalisediminis TaxID=935616 RepID=A0ABV6NHM5_9BACI
MTRKYVIDAVDKNLHASFSNAYEPILTVQSGDSVQCSTIDIGWGNNDKDGGRHEYSSREKEQAWGHPIIGPIGIEQTKPGLTLEVKINDIVPSWYGWNCAGGKWNWHNDQLGLVNAKQIKLDWVLDSSKMIASTSIEKQTFTVLFRPFMGVKRNAPKEAGVHSTIPPRYCGGNIDCKELV